MFELVGKIVVGSFAVWLGLTLLIAVLASIGLLWQKTGRAQRLRGMVIKALPFVVLFYVAWFLLNLTIGQPWADILLGVAIVGTIGYKLGRRKAQA